MGILLGAITTETIIGIIAIIVIVISLGIIIATAVRNYMLSKKAKLDDQNTLEESNAEVQDIEVNHSAEEKSEMHSGVEVTAEEMEEAQTEDISDEFVEKETEVQEIDVNNQRDVVIEENIEITADIDKPLQTEELAEEFVKSEQD